MTEKVKPSLFDLKYRKHFSCFQALDINNLALCDIQHALSCCEIDSNFTARKINKKVKNDLYVIENCLDERISITLKEIDKLSSIISNKKVKDKSSTNWKAKILITFKELHKVIKDVNRRYQYYKLVYQSLTPILRLGGYRCLCICLTETIDVVQTKLLEFGKSNATNRVWNKVSIKSRDESPELFITKNKINKRDRIKASFNNMKDSSGLLSIKSNKHKRSKSNNDNELVNKLSNSVTIPEINYVGPEYTATNSNSFDTCSSPTIQDDSDVYSNEAKHIIKQYYDKKRIDIENSITSEIVELQKKIDALQLQMQTQLDKLNKEESEALLNVNSYETTVFSGNTSSKLCGKSYTVLKDINTKLEFLSSIPKGDIFCPLELLHEENKNINMEEMLVSCHFGYEIDKNLKEYSKKMKVIYCAVNEAKNTSNYGMLKQMKFSASAAYHMLSTKTSLRYGSLRANLDVNFVRQVWDLLEDPITSFFATQLGFAPSMEKMKTNCEIRIPVPINEIDESNTSNNTYSIRCMFISPFVHIIDPSIEGNSSGRGNYNETPQTQPKKRKYSVNPLQLSGFSKKPVNTYTGDTIIIHIHGGGWVSQSPEQHLPYLSVWAKEAQIPAISIDYSLAPEKVYPTCVNECYAIYKWLQNPINCEKLGLSTIKPLRAIVCGDSAGGNLSCAITVKAIQQNILPPVGLLLHYPAVNLEMCGSLSRMIFSNDPILNLETMKCVVGCYLGDAISKANTDPLISPLIADDEIFSKYPPTVISVGDIDPLIDDATLLFLKLQNNKIRTILRVFNSLPHGFLNLPTQLPKAAIAIHDGAKYMKWLYDEYLKTQEI